MSNILHLESRSVGHMALQLLTKPVNPDDAVESQVRLTNKEILDAVRAAYPEARTTPACIAWYASKLKNDEDYRAKHGGQTPLNARKVS